MPRNVRNFWFEASVDGKEKDLASGPRNKDGGFSITIYQRDKGSVRKALYVDGFGGGGTNVLTVRDATDEVLFQFETERD